MDPNTSEATAQQLHRACERDSHEVGVHEQPVNRRRFSEPVEVQFDSVRVQRGAV